jgi:hypothetical protein
MFFEKLIAARYSRNSPGGDERFFTVSMLSYPKPHNTGP